jgi:conjugative transposon TraN protein
MKSVVVLLTGSILLNLTSAVSAQPGRYSGQALPRLFSAVLRSPAVADTPVGRTVAEKGPVAISDEALKICCEKVENDKRRIYYLTTRNGKMVMQLKGIYTREALLFFHLSLCNRSHLDYDLDSVRFLITDKGSLKSVSGKVTELRPVYVYGNMKIIRGKSREPAVIALRRFTLPPGKKLLIEAREKNGGRHLQLQADNNTLVRARLI